VKAEFQRVSDYFDGDLLPEDEARLRAWLLESDDHVDDFVVDCFVHTQLIDLLNSHQVRANELVAAEFLPKSAPPRLSRQVMGRILTLAVSIVIVSAIVFLTASRRSVVATVTGTSSAQWVSDTEKWTVGSLLKSGDEVSVDRGTLRLTFSRGGQVAIHGPGRFRVDSDTSGQLLLGSLSAFVPEHAVGFTVRTKKLTLVDLGTEFHLDLLPDDSSELQVFNGLVEIQFDQKTDNGTAHRKLQISQGRAIHFDAASGGVKIVEYNATIRLPVSEWSR